MKTHNDFAPRYHNVVLEAYKKFMVNTAELGWTGITSKPFVNYIEMKLSMSELLNDETPEQKLISIINLSISGCIAAKIKREETIEVSQHKYSTLYKLYEEEMLKAIRYIEEQGLTLNEKLKDMPNPLIRKAMQEKLPRLHQLVDRNNMHYNSEPTTLHFYEMIAYAMNYYFRIEKPGNKLRIVA